jgi:hypothetical protein
LERGACAVDALRVAVWRAVREELTLPDADLVDALAQRLAAVTDVVRGAVLRGLAVPVRDEPASGAAGRGGGTPVGPGATAEARVEDERGVAVDDPPRPDSLWRAVLEDEVGRAQRSGGKLAVLLAELRDGCGVPADVPAHVAGLTFGRFAQAVRGAIRRDDILACETERRAWVIARATGRPGARSLGSRIAHAVQEAEPWQGTPMTVGVGVAILGEDAHEVQGLIKAAGEWTLAAMSAGAAEQQARATGGDGATGSGGPRLTR